MARRRTEGRFFASFCSIAAQMSRSSDEYSFGIFGAGPVQDSVDEIGYPKKSSGHYKVSIRYF